MHVNNALQAITVKLAQLTLIKIMGLVHALLDIILEIQKNVLLVNQDAIHAQKILALLVQMLMLNLREPFVFVKKGFGVPLVDIVQICVKNVLKFLSVLSVMMLIHTQMEMTVSVKLGMNYQVLHVF